MMDEEGGSDTWLIILPEASADLWRASTGKKYWRSLGLFFALIGPGIITSNVDNDAGGITTYSLAGAEYGLTLLWTLIPITAALIIIQEMCARMGVVSGKGLSDLIRERFGARITFYLMIVLFLTNLGNTISEFAGVAASMEIFGVSKYISVPISAAIRLVAGGQGELQVRGEGVSVCLRLLPLLHHLRLHGKTGLECRRVVPAEADHPDGYGLPDDGRRRDRDDDRPLDAVLPPVIRGRQGAQGGRLPVHPDGCDHRIGHGQCGRLLHHHALRRDPLPERHPDRKRQGRRPGAGAARRGILPPGCSPSAS